jgi:undecaprenyl diphosphate synthase
MIECIKKIVELSKREPNLKITSALIKENLWTKDLPPVDLIIRTGCDDDPHWSAGFMMWDSAYSQLHFTKTLFPDFSSEEFKQIIDFYKKRERRFGS